MTYSWRFFEKFQYPSSRHISWEIRLPPPPSSSTSTSISPQKSSKYNQEKTGMNVYQTQTEKRTNIYSYSLYRMSVHVQHGRVVLENTIQVLTVSNGEILSFLSSAGDKKKRGNCFLFISNFEFFVFKSRFFQYIFKQKQQFFFFSFYLRFCRSFHKISLSLKFWSKNF